MAGYGAFTRTRRAIDSDDEPTGFGSVRGRCWAGSRIHAFGNHPRRLDSAGRDDFECDLTAEGAAVFEVRPETSLAVDFGACFACPEKLYRLAALAAGFLLVLSAAVRLAGLLGREAVAVRTATVPLRGSFRAPLLFAFALLAPELGPDL